MRKRWIALLILFVSSAFIACDKTEGEGSGSLDPGAADPEIIEGYVCAGIYDSKPTVIDNSFYQDDKVYLWLNWGNVSGNHKVRVIWLDPSDDVVADRTESFTSKTGRAITHFFLDTTSTAPLGRWVVEIEINGTFVRSYAFWVLEG